MSPPGSTTVNADADIVLRRARAGDAAVLTALAHAAKRHWNYPEEWIRLWRRALTLEASWIEQHHVYLAEVDGVPAGFYALACEGDRWAVEHMWVDPRHMGRGLGRTLFTHALASARAAGGRRLRVESDPNAEGFYRRMGAHRTGEAPSVPAGRMLPVLEIKIGKE